MKFYYGLDFCKPWFFRLKTPIRGTMLRWVYVTRANRGWWDCVRGTGATSNNDDYLVVSATYPYTVKWSLLANSHVYNRMILRQYDVTNISFLAARIQPALWYLAPMRHIRGKSVQRLRPCVR
jgi:hypothetical protein